MRWIHCAGTALLTSLTLFGCSKSDVPPPPPPSSSPFSTDPTETPPEIDVPVDEEKVIKAVGNSVLRSLMPKEESNEFSEAPDFQP